MSAPYNNQVGNTIMNMENFRPIPSLMCNLDTPIIGIFENHLLPTPFVKGDLLCLCSFYFYEITWQSVQVKFEYMHSSDNNLKSVLDVLYLSRSASETEYITFREWTNLEINQEDALIYKFTGQIWRFQVLINNINVGNTNYKTYWGKCLDHDNAQHQSYKYQK